MTGIFELNLSAVLLIIAVLIVRALLKNRLPKRFFAWIWAVVLLRLIVPFSIPVSSSLFPPDYTIPVIDRINAAEPAPIGYFNQDGSFEYQFDYTPEDRNEAGNVKDVFTAVSLCIGVVIAVGFTAVHLKYRKRYADSLPVENERALEFIGRYGLKRTVRLRYSDRISAPITYGVINPVIVLPKVCISEDFENTESVLAHELAHIRCFDVLYKWIIAGVTCLYWYNPFVWLMFLISDRDIEAACDIEAIEKSGCTNEIYSGQLIALEEKRSFDIYTRSFSAGAIKSRIKRIMKAKKAGIAGSVIAAVLSACSFTVFTSAYTGTDYTLSMWIPVHFDSTGVKELLWLEPQKYYLEGGTEEEYIQAYDDRTLQIFGYDYVSKQLEMNADYYEGLYDSEMEYVMGELEKKQKLWESRLRYELSSLPVIFLGDTEMHSEYFLTYDDENTLKLYDNIYRAETPSTAGIYQAYDDNFEPGYGYYYSDIDDTYIYVFYDVMQIYDKNGKTDGPVKYLLIRQDSRPNEIMLCTNTDSLPHEEPRGYILIDETHFRDPVSGAVYTLKGKPLLS